MVVINKMDSADAAGIADGAGNIAKVNPKATVVEADSAAGVDDPVLVKGKRVLVIEDGPTLTHGEMKIGAGTVAAQRNSAPPPWSTPGHTWWGVWWTRSRPTPTSARCSRRWGMGPIR